MFLRSTLVIASTILLLVIGASVPLSQAEEQQQLGIRFLKKKNKKPKKPKGTKTKKPKGASSVPSRSPTTKPSSGPSKVPTTAPSPAPSKTPSGSPTITIVSDPCQASYESGCGGEFTCDDLNCLDSMVGCCQALEPGVSALCDEGETFFFETCNSGTDPCQTTYESSCSGGLNCFDMNCVQDLYTCCIINGASSQLCAVFEQTCA